MMNKKKCGCIIANAANTPAVRNGYEMGGYVKSFCAEHAVKTWTDADANNVAKALVQCKLEIEQLTAENTRLQSEYDSLQKDKNAMAVYLKAVRCACNDFKKPYMQVSDFKWTIDKIILEQAK
jgi:hypothetical protein